VQAAAARLLAGDPARPPLHVSVGAAAAATGIVAEVTPRTHPLFEFRKSELIDISNSYIGSASSINFPIQLGLIRATWLIEAAN
jgi:hypothetical protein